MSKRAAGVSFIAISAFLYAARYLAAAIFGSSVTSWDASLFSAMLEYTGPGLLTASILCLIAGIAYLAWAELPQLRTGRPTERD